MDPNEIRNLDRQARLVRHTIGEHLQAHVCVGHTADGHTFTTVACNSEVDRLVLMNLPMEVMDGLDGGDEFGHPEFHPTEPI